MKIKNDRQAVENLRAAMHDFDAVLVDISPTPRTLQSGLDALSPRLVHDFKTARSVSGQVQVETLLQLRVFTKTKPRTATIHKIKSQILPLSKY